MNPINHETLLPFYCLRVRIYQIKNKTCITHVGREQSELDILLFNEVLDHISRVDRVLTQPGGSLLMGGRSGAGRRTAVSLVAFMHQITLYTPNVSRNFGVKQFKNDLKNVSTYV